MISDEDCVDQRQNSGHPGGSGREIEAEVPFLKSRQNRERQRWRAERADGPLERTDFPSMKHQETRNG